MGIKHPRSGRISQTEAQKQKLVVCRTGKQAGLAEEKEKASSKEMWGTRGPEWRPASRAHESEWE